MDDWNIVIVLPWFRDPFKKENSRNTERILGIWIGLTHVSSFADILATFTHKSKSMVTKMVLQKRVLT